MSNITLKMDPIDKILLKRALGKNGKAAHFLASEVKRLSDPYVPKRSGILKGTAVVTDSAVIYESALCPAASGTSTRAVKVTAAPAGVSECGRIAAKRS